MSYFPHHRQGSTFKKTTRVLVGGLFFSKEIIKNPGFFQTKFSKKFSKRLQKDLKKDYKKI
jgi:hypothetical protein